MTTEEPKRAHEWHIHKECDYHSHENDCHREHTPCEGCEAREEEIERLRFQCAQSYDVIHARAPGLEAELARAQRVVEAALSMFTDDMRLAGQPRFVELREAVTTYRRESSDPSVE